MKMQSFTFTGDQKQKQIEDYKTIINMKVVKF